MLPYSNKCLQMKPFFFLNAGYVETKLHSKKYDFFFLNNLNIKYFFLVFYL